MMQHAKHGMQLTALVLLMLVIATPTSPQSSTGSTKAREKLTALRNNPNLAPQAGGRALPLGDVLFASGSVELRSSDDSNLNKLVSFLNQFSERRVQIEGHTDNVGSAEYNQGLPQRRANSASNI